ncbi:MAG: hypothetical protein Q8R55_05830 [Candidatus Taylorbacteria bacterium]|nr:hypothetical protein [Candidatus Taylorbacteria bacterium]
MKQRELHKKYVRGTDEGVLVKEIRALVCHLNKYVLKILEITDHKVYIKTRVLKHLYDKRNAQEYDLILENLHLIIKKPDKIYENKNEKRGEFCFYKIVKNKGILCPIEKNVDNGGFDIVTAFSGKNLENYLKNFKELFNKI